MKKGQNKILILHQKSKLMTVDSLALLLKFEL